MPIDFSDQRYEGRPLLRLMDAYAMAVIGELTPADEKVIETAVVRLLGPGDDWKETVRRMSGLPGDMDARILYLWDQQPDGVNPSEFVLALSDANFAPLIDPD